MTYIQILTFTIAWLFIFVAIDMIVRKRLKKKERELIREMEKYVSLQNDYIEKITNKYYILVNLYSIASKTSSADVQGYVHALYTCIFCDENLNN